MILKEHQTQPKRPFCMEYELAKSDIFKAINKAIEERSIPMFLVEGIVSEALHQVKEGARIEVGNAKKDYERQCAEYERTTGKNGE